MKPTNTPNANSEAALALPWRSAVRPGKARATVSRWREAASACGAFEWATFAYLAALNGLILLFPGNLPGAARYFVAHLGVAVAVVTLCWAAQRWGYRSLQFIRHWYPLALFIGFFEELGHLVHLIFPGWFDRWLIAFDYALTGVHPTVWLEQFACPVLNDFMQMAYSTYFFYLVILAGILYERDKMRPFWTMMTATAAAYYLIYVLSILLPIESPYYSLAALQRVELSGGFFTALINQVERFGRVHGAAFPSAHVAGSFVALLGAWRYRRRLFWVFLPFFLSMLVATVYARYHYVADGLAGLLVGAVGFRVGQALMATKKGRHAGGPVG